MITRYIISNIFLVELFKSTEFDVLAILLGGASDFDRGYLLGMLAMILITILGICRIFRTSKNSETSFKEDENDWYEQDYTDYQDSSEGDFETDE